MKRGLVLSGGGAFGSYQVGALKALVSKGKTWDYIAGVSVGAINGSFLATYSKVVQFDAVQRLEYMWLNDIKGNSSIYKPWYFYPFNYVASLWKGSLNSTKPLTGILEKYLDDNKIKASGIHLRVGTACLTSGQYEVANEAYTNIKNWVLASASMPLIFNPTEIDGQYYLDGGIRNITPLSDIIDLGLDEIDVILADSLKPIPIDKEKFNNVINIGKRALQITIDEIFRTDIAYCKDEKIHNVKVNIYSPENELPFDAFNFDPKNIKLAIDLGFKETLAKI